MPSNVCTGVHDTVFELLEELVCVFLPPGVFLSVCFPGRFFFSECYSVHVNLTLQFGWFNGDIFRLVLLAATLNCWTSLVYLYFRSRFLSLQVKRI